MKSCPVNFSRSSSGECQPCDEGWYSTGIQSPCLECSVAAQVSQRSEYTAQIIDTVCPESNAVVEYWSDSVVQVSSATGQSSYTVIAWFVSLHCACCCCAFAACLAVCLQLKDCKQKRKGVMPQPVETTEMTAVEVAEHTVSLP